MANSLAPLTRLLESGHYVAPASFLSIGLMTRKLRETVTAKNKRAIHLSGRVGLGWQKEHSDADLNFVRLCSRSYGKELSDRTANVRALYFSRPQADWGKEGAPLLKRAFEQT